MAVALTGPRRACVGEHGICVAAGSVKHVAADAAQMAAGVRDAAIPVGECAADICEALVLIDERCQLAQRRRRTEVLLLAELNKAVRHVDEVAAAPGNGHLAETCLAAALD
jgi:hypothetical protein